MRRERCTHLLISDTVDVEYICGFRSSHALLLLAPRCNWLLTDSRYQEAAERFCRNSRAWRCVVIKENYAAALSPLAPRRSIIGFQSDVMTVDELDKLTKALPGVRFAAVPRRVSLLSVPKNRAELAAMKKAAAIGDRAFALFLATLAPGVSEQEAAGALDRICSELGSEKPSFDTIVLFGARSSLPHGRPGAQKLKAGDMALVDFGCTINGLCSDMTRTVAYGAPSPRLAEVYGVVRRAQAKALAAAKPGITAASLDAVARSIIAGAGFGDAFGHGLGHGVGRRVHEPPRVSSSSDEMLAEGSVITIEPGIYLPGIGGVRIEDMVVLTKRGARPLTHSPRKLMEIKKR
jgi:Xaa-Pro aminopeptidase